MQIVIDINDLLYEYIEKGKDLSPQQYDKIELAIVNGTPLPEGHGRLIDADVLEETKEMVDTFGGGCKYAVRMDNIRLIPSVIKADKAESERK